MNGTTRRFVLVILSVAAACAAGLATASAEVGPVEVAFDGAERWALGPVYAVARSPEHLVFGSGTALLVADTSASGERLSVAGVMLPDVVRGIDVAGHLAYVADGRAGLVNLFGIESPGITAAPALAQYVLGLV